MVILVSMNFLKMNEIVAKYIQITHINMGDKETYFIKYILFVVTSTVLNTYACVYVCMCIYLCLTQPLLLLGFCF